MLNLIFFRYVLTIVLMVLSAVMLIPTAVSFYYGDGYTYKFLSLNILLFFTSYLIKPISVNIDEIKIKSKDVFIINFLVWVIVCFVAALPYVLFLKLNFVNAWFEAVSGITTTGASIFSSLESIKPSLLIWRQLTNWLGGIGFMSFGLLVFANLNIGEMKLIQLDGQLRDKVFSKYRNVALYIIYVYLCLTIASITSYYLAGVSLFNAIAMSFSTISTGGFAPVDDGLLAFSNHAQVIMLIFITISSLPFVAYIVCLKERSIRPLFKDQQIKYFMILLLIFSSLLIAHLFFYNNFSLSEAIHMGILTVINFMSTSGFTQGPFDTWGSSVIILLAIIWLIGGCSGSTSAGIKTFRIVVMFKVLMRSLKLIIKPKALQPVYFNNKQLDLDIQASIVNFIILYLVTAVVFTALFVFNGMDLISGISSAINSLSNIGPSMGDLVGSQGNFSNISDINKGLMTFAMLLGRLELTSVLVLLMPAFWKF